MSAQYTSELITRTITLTCYGYAFTVAFFGRWDEERYSLILEGSKSDASVESKILYLSSARMIFNRMGAVFILGALLFGGTARSYDQLTLPMLILIFIPAAIVRCISEQLEKIEKRLLKTGTGVFTTGNLIVAFILGILLCFLAASEAILKSLLGIWSL